MKIRKIVVDIYRLTDKEAEEKELYYKNRIKLYNYATQEIDDCGLRDESIGKYSIGQIIED